MLNVTVTHTNRQSGAPVIVAKANGKQRTVPVDLSKSNDANRGAAVGTLLAVLLDDRQKAMLMHPSAKQRVRVESLSDAGGKYRFNVNV